MTTRGPRPSSSVPAASSWPADNTYDLGHVPVWHRDRMIVIGDAAHAPAPSSGQGASMAMEDGVVLAMALRDRRRSTSAFAAYERARRERVERIVAYGARSSSAKIPGRCRSGRSAMPSCVSRSGTSSRSARWRGCTATGSIGTTRLAPAGRDVANV